MITTASTTLAICLVLVQTVNGLPSSTRQTKLASDGTSVPPSPPSHPAASAAHLKLLQQQQHQRQQQLKRDRSLTLPFTHSDERVVISNTWPLDPPMSLSDLTLNATGTDKRSPRSARSPDRQPLGRPVMRSSGSSRGLVPACESVSQWVQLTEVEDAWEKRVSVVQDFDNGSGPRVKQYFYETYCHRPAGVSSGADRPQSCVGTDAANYDSVCLEKYAYVYGKVRYAGESEERWTYVKIRASCNCAVSRKNNNDRRSYYVRG